MNLDTLSISFKKRRGKVEHLIVYDGRDTYQLNRINKGERQKIFTRDQLKEDFRQLQNIINRLHPSLHGPISPHEFNQLCFKAHEAIDSVLSVEDFYKIVGPIVTSLGCGHTSVWMPRDYWEENNTGLFPLELIFLKDGTCVKKGYDNCADIPYGSQIILINGEPIEEIIDNLKSYISADAFSNGYRNYRLNKRFSYLYALQYGLHEKFTVVYKGPEENVLRVSSCAPVSVARIRENFRFSPVLELNFIDPEVLAMIRISSFYYLDNQKFCDFIDSAFEELHKKGTPNLIIDIRRNDGGCPLCAAHLLSYLAEEPFVYFEEPYGKFADLAKPISVKENRFRGELFILIDGGCFSTSGQFCSLIKFHKIGQLIGTETGGAHICNESKKTIELKHTRLQLQVARGSFGTAVEGLSANQGVRPDILIEPTIQAFQKGVDPVLEYAIRKSDGPI
jgi:hypothetical protein